MASRGFSRLSWNKGRVAERLMAPVLKTGEPKGFVSSNLTPSAIFRVRLRLRPKSRKKSGGRIPRGGPASHIFQSPASLRMAAKQLPAIPRKA